MALASRRDLLVRYDLCLTNHINFISYAMVCVSIEL